MKGLLLSDVDLGRPADRPVYSVLSCKKFEAEYDFQLKSWQEGLADYFKKWLSLSLL